MGVGALFYERFVVCIGPSDLGKLFKHMLGIL